MVNCSWSQACQSADTQNHDSLTRTATQEDVKELIQ
jgi:hypothetical protein